VARPRRTYSVEGGEIAVSPAINRGANIAAAVDPLTTRLCRSTPIGTGLETAIAELAAIADPSREQFAVLLTDGQDTCDEALALANAHALAAADRRLYVIGFDRSGGSGVDNGLLSDLACLAARRPDSRRRA
jgi:Mg-chelatase subunit ChlD